MTALEVEAPRHSLFDDAQALVTGTLFVGLGLALFREAGLMTGGTVGLAFNLPVFSGFLVQNQVKEALALEEKAKSDLDNAERSVAQFTRAAVFSLKSGLGKVKALETAETSTQSALDANMLGYQVGVRINLDVLNSQTKLFATKRDLDQTRYNVLVGGLRLRQAAGTLKVDDLNAVNALLAK